MPTLHFVRHGETDWNREGRIQGVADVPLSALGREQAQELAASLATRPIGALYSSDLRRALETAKPLGERLGVRAHTAPALRERDFGVNEGRMAAEVAAELGEEVARPSRAVSSGAEHHHPARGRRHLLRSSEVARDGREHADFSR